MYCSSVESAESLMYLEIGMPAPALAGGVVFVDFRPAWMI